MNVLTLIWRFGTVQLETKCLLLQTPVTIGYRFGDWQACWLRGWTRNRLSYLVMAVTDSPLKFAERLALAGPGNRFTKFLARQPLFYGAQDHPVLLLAMD